MEQIICPLGGSGLPLNIVYLSSGHIAFVKTTNNFTTIFDNQSEGIHAVISDVDMLVGSTRILYNTMIDYKQLPELLQWLIQQKLESPVQ